MVRRPNSCDKLSGAHLVGTACARHMAQHVSAANPETLGAARRKKPIPQPHPARSQRAHHRGEHSTDTAQKVHIVTKARRPRYATRDTPHPSREQHAETPTSVGDTSHLSNLSAARLVGT